MSHHRPGWTLPALLFRFLNLVSPPDRLLHLPAFPVEMHPLLLVPELSLQSADRCHSRRFHRSHRSSPAALRPQAGSRQSGALRQVLKRDQSPVQDHHFGNPGCFHRYHTDLLRSCRTALQYCHHRQGNPHCHKDLRYKIPVLHCTLHHNTCLPKTEALPPGWGLFPEEAR